MTHHFDDDFEATVDIPQGSTTSKTDEFEVTTDGAQLVVLLGPGSGKRFPIREELIIGRSATCPVWIPDEAISRQHARIVKRRGSYFLEDLASKNGTAVNGLATKEHNLSFGDKITLGSNSVLVFTYTDPLEAQLLLSQKLETVGRLAAGVSHEFNNILSVIVTNVSVIEQQNLAEDERKACVREIREAAGRGSELTRQMLDFSRSSAIELAYVNASELLEDVSALARRTLGPNVQIVEEIEPKLGANGDRLQLYQALMNLCINSKDAFDSNGQITLRGKKVQIHEKDRALLPELNPGDFILLEVEDNGAGMNQHILDRVFEPFYTTKQTGHGTGLGLSMVRGVVHSHRGAITIKSVEGRGTRVQIFLPYIELKEKKKKRNSDLRSNKELNAHILLVDDDQLVSKASSRALKAMGCVVSLAFSGMEAIEIYRAKADDIDIVVLDVSMPGLSGEETYLKLKKLNPAIKTIIASGYAEEDMKARLLNAGIKHYLSKPFNPKDLRSAIEDLLFD